jgi:hypothetical protein
MRHFETFEKKLFYKSCILSKKLHQHFFLKNCHFEKLNGKKRCRHHLGFSHHFEFLRLATFFYFFLAQNLQENVKNIVFYII